MLTRRAVWYRCPTPTIDRPIVHLVALFTAATCCFPLQSCCGHVLLAPGPHPRNLERLPEQFKGRVRYRIAYLALCIENSPQGRALRESVEGLHR